MPHAIEQVSPLHSKVSVLPIVPAKVDESSEGDLKTAFAMFNQMSKQLADSYGLLETQVTDLNQELNAVTAQRFDELAQKECLANRLESLLNFLPGGVVVLDAAGRVSECNPAAREMLGEPLETMFWRDVIKRCFSPRCDDGHEVSTYDGRRISIATRSLGVDGQIILLTDLTETRHLQSQVSRNERLSAMGKMVSALAHQIRTPLSTAMLYAGHLCGNELQDDKRQQFSEKLAKRLNHMERQVQDMLLFAKGELPINETCTVEELQQALLEEMEVPLMASGVECRWNLDLLDRKICCNREALVGALLNLVNNAIQAAEGEITLDIIFSSVEPNQLSISVADTGPGIAEDQLQAVQEQFVTTKPQGTGLGLSVVQAVAKAHSGRFTLQSQLGRGTCASVILPLLDE